MAKRRARVTDPAAQRSVWNGDGWVGEHDLLPAPPEPFFPRGWLGWVIAIAIVGCLVGGALVLTGVVS